jgi:hypothetical protein
VNRCNFNRGNNPRSKPAFIAILKPFSGPESKKLAGFSLLPPGAVAFELLNAPVVPKPVQEEIFVEEYQF